MDARNEQFTGALKRGASTSMVLGILLTILGFLAMMSPLIAGMAVAMTVGVALTLGGVLRSVYAFKARSWGQGFLCLVLGVLTVLGGIVLLARPMFALATLTLLLAAYFLFDGITEVIYGLRLRPVNGWGWLVFAGVMSTLLAIMIWRQWPVSGAWAIGILVGVKLLFAGSSLIGLGAAARSLEPGTAQTAR